MARSSLTCSTPSAVKNWRSLHALPTGFATVLASVPCNSGVRCAATTPEARPQRRNALYFSAMNASSPAQPESVRERPPLLERLRDFWRRVSEGRQIGDLWAQFTADAPATYGFYSRQVDWDPADKKTRLQRGRA